MKNLIAKAGVTAVSSALIFTTVGTGSAQAFVIKATETFSVSEDKTYIIPPSTVPLSTSPDDRQFRSYNEVTDGSGFAGTTQTRFNDSSIPALRAAYPGADVENMAIVGSFTSEEIRGLVEFDLNAYLNPALTAEKRNKLIDNSLLSFTVFKQGGLSVDNQNPLSGVGGIEVSYYQSDGLESVEDYGDGISKNGEGTLNPGDVIEGTDAFPLTSVFDPGVNPFFTSGALLLSAGDKVQLNIAAAVRDALDKGWTTLGFRLQQNIATTGAVPGQCANPSCGAITFHDFKITAVPTPAAILPTLFGMGMAAIRKKRNALDPAESEA